MAKLLKSILAVNMYLLHRLKKLLLFPITLIRGEQEYKCIKQGKVDFSFSSKNDKIKKEFFGFKMAWLPAVLGTGC